MCDAIVEGGRYAWFEVSEDELGDASVSFSFSTLMEGLVLRCFGRGGLLRRTIVDNGLFV